MRRIIGLLGYCVIGFSILFLSSIVFAQGRTVESTTENPRIPAARIIDWKGETPIVNGNEGWQEQALGVDDKVCCPAGQAEDDFVLVALNSSADNLARLSSGTCLTIVNIDGKGVAIISQHSGEILFDLELLKKGSTFTVDTPDATIGVTGTTFNVDVDSQARSTEFEVLKVDPDDSLTVDDKNPDMNLGDLDKTPEPEYALGSNQKLTIIRGAANIGPISLDSKINKSILRRKQLMREIVTELKGMKSEYYLDEDVEDIMDTKGDKYHFPVHD